MPSYKRRYQRRRNRSTRYTKRARTSRTRYTHRKRYSRRRPVNIYRRRISRWGRNGGKRIRRGRLVSNGLIPIPKLHTVVQRKDFNQQIRDYENNPFHSRFTYVPALFNPCQVMDSVVYWPPYLEKYIGWADSGAFYNILKKNGHDFKISIAPPYYETDAVPPTKTIVPGYFYALLSTTRGEYNALFDIIVEWEASSPKYETLHDLLRTQPGLLKYKYVAPSGTLNSTKTSFKLRHRMNYRKFYKKNFRNAIAAVGTGSPPAPDGNNYFYFDTSRVTPPVQTSYNSTYDRMPTNSAPESLATPFPFINIFWVPEDIDLVSQMPVTFTTNLTIKNYITLEGVSPYRPIPENLLIPVQTLV